MVTPTCYPPSEAGRRYSRACPPYPVSYSDRRSYLSSRDSRTATMAEREGDVESQPRKRIAVACGRCRKRKIRCSGDTGHGLPCSNCKNAGHEPCLFLRVSSTETHLRNDNNEFGYNLEAARPYSHQARIAGSPLSSISQYSDLSAGDGVNSYRPNQYPYGNGSKGYYSAMPGWSAGYQNDGVDYGLNYSYPMLSHDPAHMVQGYGRYGSGKSLYVDNETSSYPYGNLIQRPTVSSDSATGFSLSGMAASLPNASDRVVPSDRLLPQVNRTLTGSSGYRPDGIGNAYSNTKASPTGSMSEVSYGSLSSNFETQYSAGTALPSGVLHRPTGQNDNTNYLNSAASASDVIYTSSDHALRSAEDTGPGLSYIYGGTKAGTSRRGSESSGGASPESVLPNGHVYVPDTHESHAPPPQSYVASQDGVEGATRSSGRRSGSGGSAHLHTDGRRRSAGNLRGG
ncbi:hypothetical protein GGS23DRAFT_617844 [Durotheca rogersii]|uniref:uncharacterized protein n=1 Tax=Durotheca rogersii TaxID=419775 RepID=UPI00221FE7E3|nr:uncharacterized protein GGS23DRAFT_617844 [Durotheca rogersii]KAI5856185.1 hypothetical protein GGS23DRAFT_617844 [Durotheca rogersii]